LVTKGVAWIIIPAIRITGINAVIIPIPIIKPAAVIIPVSTIPRPWAIVWCAIAVVGIIAIAVFITNVAVVISPAAATKLSTAAIVSVIESTVIKSAAVIVPIPPIISPTIIIAVVITAAVVISIPPIVSAVIIPTAAIITVIPITPVVVSTTIVIPVTPIVPTVIITPIIIPAAIRHGSSHSRHLGHRQKSRGLDIADGRGPVRAHARHTTWVSTRISNRYPNRITGRRHIAVSKGGGRGR
jgi:hypothetical protein